MSNRDCATEQKGESPLRRVGQFVATRNLALQLIHGVGESELQ